jgi:hypothetical protein
MGKLTVAGIKALRHDGTKPRPIRFGDGDGLYLQIAKGNSKQWLFRFAMEGREREMGLGPVALSDADAEAGALTLAGARTAAREAASLVKDGVDPIEARKRGGNQGPACRQGRNLRSRRARPCRGACFRLAE